MSEVKENKLDAGAATKTRNAPNKRATAKTATSRPSSRKNTESQKGAQNPHLETEESDEPVLSPFEIMNKAINKLPVFNEPEQMEDQFNHIEPETKSSMIRTEEDLLPGRTGRTGGLTDLIDDDILEEARPHIRMVAIKKYNRNNFRLGLERSAEKYNKLPGTRYGFTVDRVGNKFKTGLQDKPEVRKRLEKALGVNLGDESKYWESFVFNIEDKQHGHLLNFDDRQFGPYNEMVYYAMTDSSTVAVGLHGIKDKKDAEWYIEDKEAEAVMFEKEMDYDLEASEIFGSLNTTRLRGIGKLAGLAVHNVKAAVVKTEVFKWLRAKDATNANSPNAKAFLQYAKMGDSEFAVRVVVNDAVRLNVIRKNKTGDYIYGQEILGHDVDQVVGKLKQATNSHMRMGIESQVEAKSR
jgi:hypothetical protein